MSRALPPVGNELASRLFAFLDSAEQWGYGDPQTVEAFERLRDTATAAQVLSAEDQHAEDTVNVHPEPHSAPPELTILDGGLPE